MGGIAALAIIALGAVAIPRGAPRQSPSHLTAIGTASVNVVPNEAMISLGVQTTATTVLAAQHRNDTLMARIQKAIEGLGIPKRDIQTENYNVTQNYTPNGAPKGFEVDDEVAVTVYAQALAGKVVAAATGAGANEVNGVTWSVANPAEYTGKAYVLALGRARTMARKLAAGLGVHLDGVASIQVVTNPQVTPVYAPLADTVAGRAPVQPGTEPVMATLRVVFDYR